MSKITGLQVQHSEPALDGEVVFKLEFDRDLSPEEADE